MECKLTDVRYATEDKIVHLRKYTLSLLPEDTGQSFDTLDNKNFKKV
jgi:hypothetical protein